MTKEELKAKLKDKIEDDVVDFVCRNDTNMGEALNFLGQIFEELVSEFRAEFPADYNRFIEKRSINLV